MPTVYVAYNENTREARVSQASAVPGGFKAVGSFEHPDPVYPGSVVVYHGVQDLLYHQFVQDMGYVTITYDSAYNFKYVTSIRAMDKSFSLRLNDESYKQARVNAEVWPPYAANNQLTYTSSDPAVVTVNPEGLLTAVKPGLATVTVAAPGSLNGSIKLEIPVAVGGVVNEITDAGKHSVAYDPDGSNEDTVAFTITPANEDLVVGDIVVTANGTSVPVTLVEGGFTVDVTGVEPVNNVVNILIKITFPDDSVLEKLIKFQ